MNNISLRNTIGLASLSALALILAACEKQPETRQPAPRTSAIAHAPYATLPGPSSRDTPTPTHIPGVYELQSMQNAVSQKHVPLPQLPEHLIPVQPPLYVYALYRRPPPTIFEYHIEA